LILEFLQAFPPVPSELPKPPKPPKPPSNDPIKPHWDGESRTLFWSNVVIRTYTARIAENQIELLEAFEAAKWPPTIPNPFRNKAGLDTRKLGQTVYNLNQGLKPGTNRFHLDGSGGDGVDWRPVSSKS
jgi:hypothetical protein